MAEKPRPRERPKPPLDSAPAVETPDRRSDAEFAKGLLQMRAGDGAALRKSGEKLVRSAGEKDSRVQEDLLDVELAFFGLSKELSRELEVATEETAIDTGPETAAGLRDLEAFLETGKMDPGSLVRSCDKAVLDAYRQTRGSDAFFTALYRLDSKFHGYLTREDKLSHDWKASLGGYFKKSDAEFFGDDFFQKLNQYVADERAVSNTNGESRERRDQREENDWFVSNVLEANVAVVGRKADALIDSVALLSKSSGMAYEKKTYDIGHERMGQNARDWEQLRTVFAALEEDQWLRGNYFSVIKNIFSSETMLFPIDMGLYDTPVSTSEASDFFAKNARYLGYENTSVIKSTYDRFVAAADYVSQEDVARMVPIALSALTRKDVGEIVPRTVEAFAGKASARVVDAAIIVSGRIGYAEDAIQRLRDQGAQIDAQIVDTWDRCSFRSFEAKLQTVRNNLERMDELEKERPGCVRVLREEFGIENFARYPKELLIEQFDTKDDQSLPYGIVINPKADHNGAFAGGPDGGAIANVWKTLKGKFRLRIFEASSRFGVARTLIRTEQRYQHDGGGKIAFAMIGGHGEPDSIQFGDGENAVRLGIDDLGGSVGVAAKNKFFEPNPTIILSSCSTGKYGGIGQELSAVLGARVIGPDVPTPLPSVSVSLDASGKPKFDVTYKNAKSMAYQDGEHELPSDA